MRSFVILVLAALTISGCSRLGSASLGSLNPFAGSGDAVDSRTDQRLEDARADLAFRDDGRSPIQQITGLSLDRGVAGVIVRADGIAPALGYHSARLRPVNSGRPDENGVARFEFVVMPPERDFGAGTTFTRAMSVAVFLGNTRLQGVRSITVAAAENAETRRIR